MDENISKVKIMDLKPSEFRFKPVKPKSKFRALVHNLDTLIVSLPKLRIPFDSKISKYGQLDINMSLGNTYSKKITSEALIEKFKQIDIYMQEIAKKENWLAGFPEDMEYNPIVKSNNINYPPTIKPKIAKKKDTIESVFFDSKREIIDIVDENSLVPHLKKGTALLSSIEFAGVYFMGKSWGMTIKFYHAKVYESDIDPNEKSEQNEEPLGPSMDFLDSSESESDN